MKPNLKPADPLSQVVFIHDYLQLVFQEAGFSIYNVAAVEVEGKRIKQGQTGFCDAVVALIGQRVDTVSHSSSAALCLVFEKGARFLVLSDDESIKGPEAFEFQEKDGPLVVEQNA
jgi:hypothetical protein